MHTQSRDASSAVLAACLCRHALLITESPEPSDVQYENMEHGSWDRAGRMLLTACCSYIALALGFFLISLATASRINVDRMIGIDTNNCNSCRLMQDGRLGLSEADRELYASCDKVGVTPSGQSCSVIEKQCYRCYCYTSLTSGQLRYVTSPTQERSGVCCISMHACIGRSLRPEHAACKQ